MKSSHTYVRSIPITHTKLSYLYIIILSHDRKILNYTKIMSREQRRVAAQKIENIIIIWKHLRLLNSSANNTLRPLVAVRSARAQWSVVHKVAPPVPLPTMPEHLVVRGRAPSRPICVSRRFAAAIRRRLVAIRHRFVAIR